GTPGGAPLPEIVAYLQELADVLVDSQMEARRGDDAAGAGDGIESAARNAHKVAEVAAKSGDDYLMAFDAAMTRAGFVYTGGSCECPDDGEQGHLPACGYSDKPPEISGVTAEGATIYKNPRPLPQDGGAGNVGE